MRLTVSLLLWLIVGSAQPPQEAPATVYVYRPAESHSVRGHDLTILCDGQPLARLPYGRFFAAKIAPGEHFISDKRTRYHVKVKVESGGEYYVKAEWWMGTLTTKRVFSWVAPEQGRDDVKLLKPIDPGHITDHARVAVPGSDRR